VVPERVRAGSVAAVVAALLAWAPAAAAKPRFVPPGTIRPPTVTTNMDTNPANLASAVLTHAFGQLPDFIDGASIRLLPYDVYRAFEPGRTVARTYRVTTYVLRVLPRKPNKAEVASAPDDDAPKPGDNTPLTFRPPGR
jgi:hypothetical protein